MRTPNLSGAANTGKKLPVNETGTQAAGAEGAESVSVTNEEVRSIESLSGGRVASGAITGQSDDAGAGGAEGAVGGGPEVRGGNGEVSAVNGNKQTKKSKQEKAASEGKEVTEMDYCGMLNRVLPPEIRALAWAPVSQGFSARFSCSDRTYRRAYRMTVVVSVRTFGKRAWILLSSLSW